MPDLDKTAKSEEEIDVIDIEATDSDDDDMSVKSNDSKEKTSIMRKQLVDNMDKAIANLDSSTETDSSLKHS